MPGDVRADAGNEGGLRPMRGIGDAAIQQVLDRIAAAVTAGDGAAAASCWATPAFIVSDEHEQVVQSSQEIAAFFGGAKQQYNQQGIRDTRAEVERMEWIGERLALVTVRWPWLDADQREVGAETSTYLLRRSGDGEFKFRIAIMHSPQGAAPAGKSSPLS